MRSSENMLDKEYYMSSMEMLHSCGEPFSGNECSKWKWNRNMSGHSFFFLAGRGNPRLTPELKRNVVSPFRFSTDGTNGFNMTSSTRFGKKSKVFPRPETRCGVP